MTSPLTFGKVKDPCGDCWDGHCTMNCSPREIVEETPAICGCIGAINDHLKQHNTQLATSFSLAPDGGDAAELPIIAVEKIDTKKRGRPVHIVPTFCPFCGTKYLRKADANG